MKIFKILAVWTLLLCVILAVCGCVTNAGKRRIEYIDSHPELSSDQKNLILTGKLWVGMTLKEARASLGNPTSESKDMLGKEEVWTYIYKNQYTHRRDYEFERGLRLEFREGRLADWRED